MLLTGRLRTFCSRLLVLLLAGVITAILSSAVGIASSRDSDLFSQGDDVLVVDDDASLREVLRVALRDEGYTVDVAADGNEGLIRLEAGHYRLLLLDLMLPDMTGLRILERLRSERALRPSAVVVLSAADDRARIFQALEAEADDYIVKPFDLDDLLLRVTLWLRRVGPSAPISPPGLRIHSLGRFYIEHGGEIRLREGDRARKVATLFKYLLTHQERTVSPSEIIALLWPKISEDLAATSLRSLLHQLRQRLGFEAHGTSCFEHTSSMITLRLGPADWWDVTEFSAWIEEGARWQSLGETAKALDAYAAGAALYSGDYLPGDMHESWTRRQRQRLRENWLRTLEMIAALHGKQGAHWDEEHVLREVIRTEPFREHSYRVLMRLLAEQGRGGEALILYRQLEEAFRLQFEATPAPETQILAAHIRSSGPQIRTSS